MLSLWLLLTLLASLASATTPSPSRHKLAFYLGVGLLLGPGVLGLSRVLERRPAKTPWERYHRQLVQLLTVLLVVPPFALIHGIWAFSLATSSPFLELWQATSLALPLPTLFTQRAFQWTRDYGNCWIPFALFGPAWATRSLLGCGYGTPLVGKLWRSCDLLDQLHSRRGSFLSPETLKRRPTEDPEGARQHRQQLESALLGLIAPVLSLQSGLWALNFLVALGLLLPFWQLSGWIGG